MKYVCPVCGYVYDEEKEGKPFSELDESWVCPWCGAAKKLFAPEMKAEQPAAVPAAPVEFDEEMTEFSAGELSALCSNLARGCEKQYMAEEAGLFKEIADYFAARTPAIADASVEKLKKLVEEDLSERYAEVQSTASANGDRGTQRVRVWGEKVTNIVNSLLDRYMAEGTDFLKGKSVWVCTTCGFVWVGESAPELCPVCKVPAWKFEKIEGRA